MEAYFMDIFYYFLAVALFLVASSLIVLLYIYLLKRKSKQKIIEYKNELSKTIIGRIEKIREGNKEQNKKGVKIIITGFESDSLTIDIMEY